MKAILSVEALAPVLTGIGRYAWELAVGLPKHSDLDRVRFYRQGQWVNDLESLLTAPDLSSERRKQGFRIKPPLWLKKKKMNWDCRGQVFHGPNYFLPPCVDVGVVTVHDLSVFKFPETHPAARIRQFEQSFSDSMSRATHLITDSESTRQEVIDFLAWPSAKITAVPLGVSRKFKPAAAFELATTLDAYALVYGAYTLCVSTLEPRKKIESLLQSYQRIPQSLRSRYPLVLVGSTGWLSENLQAEIKRFSSQGWLHYLGFVRESDLPALYAGARLFVYPSIYEGFGLPVLEAMASGIPVVASNRTSLPEVSDGAALLVDPDDIDALTLAIEKGLNDESWRALARDRGVLQAQRFSWDRCVGKTVEIYKNIKP